METSLIKNRKNNIQLEDNLTKIKRDKYILDKLTTDYNAVYYIELNKGAFEKLKIVKGTYADIVFKEKNLIILMNVLIIMLIVT